MPTDKEVLTAKISKLTEVTAIQKDTHEEVIVPLDDDAKWTLISNIDLLFDFLDGQNEGDVDINEVAPENETGIDTRTKDYFTTPLPELQGFSLADIFVIILMEMEFLPEFPALEDKESPLDRYNGIHPFPPNS